MNELFAPELLQPQIEVVDCLLEQIKSAEENLQKIQTQVHFLSKRSDDEINAILTTEEATFLRSHKKNVDNLFNKLALDHIPARARNVKFSEFSASSTNASNEAPKPNLNATVF